ncbi:MAG: TetR family transcriptional regulator [Actinomycetota bacterium]
MTRSGRRAGWGGTKEAILKAAREVFHYQGYAGATMRAIAAGAGVDPALIHHYFDNKRSLFVAAMHLPVDPDRIVQVLTGGDRARLGETLVGLFFSAWESPGADPFIAVLRSAMTHEDAAAMLRDMVSEEVIGPVAAALEVDHAQLRTSLVGAHMAGLAMMRYIIQLEPLASADPDLLVEAVGPAVQRYLTEPLWD